MAANARQLSAWIMGVLSDAVIGLKKGSPLTGEDPTWRAHNKLAVGRCTPGNSRRC